MSKSKKNKGKQSNGPQEEALEKSLNQTQNLKLELSNALYAAKLAENRRLTAYNDKIKSVIALETFKNDNKLHTAYIVSEYETIISKLHKKIDELEKNNKTLNNELEKKQLENDYLRNELDNTLIENKNKIESLENKINDQTILFQDIITESCNKLEKLLIQDFENIYKVFKSFSINTTDLYELEFMRPPFLDEESTEYVKYFNSKMHLNT